MPVAEKIATESSISEQLLPEFDTEFANTRKFLALVPDDKLTWKPHPKSAALGRLAWHLSDMPEWCKNILTQDSLAMTSEDGAKARTEAEGKTREEILARFDAALKAARTAFVATPDEAWSVRWKMEWEGTPIIDDPRSDVYRKWVISHMVHHRAQFGVYLRLNDIAIPGCYGPSADEMPSA